jgi:lysophospholipase L1-like esterase
MKRLVTFGCSNTYGQGLEDPSAQAWPVVLADMMAGPVVNLGSPGASNLEILTTILNFKFNQGDCVVIAWTYPVRDLIFKKPSLIKNENLKIGPWLETELYKQWCYVHNDFDIGTRSWLNIHHANVFLQLSKLETYNFFLDHNWLMKYKPKYINIPILNINFLKLRDIDVAEDNLHPGPKTHKAVAEKLNKLICK